MRLYACADTPHCGRPFFAFGMEDVRCPYCGEAAAPVDVDV